MSLAGQTALVYRILAGEAEAADQLQDCNVTTIRAVAQQLGARVKLNQPKEDLLSDPRKNINAGITGPPLFSALAVKCKSVPRLQNNTQRRVKALMWGMVRGMLPQGVWVIMQMGTLQNFPKHETLMVLR